MFDRDKINSILMHSRNVPFYNKLYADIPIEKIQSYEDFINVPVVDKNDIMFNSDSLLMRDVDVKDLRMERTSGSTGKVLDIYWRKDDFIRSNKEIWKLRKKWHNIDVNSKMLQFHPFIADNTSIYNTKVIKLSENILSFSWVDIVDENIDLFYKEMISFQPEWLYGPPSAIFQFATLLKQYDFSAAKSLKYIELAGDYVLNHHRKLIDAFFQIPTGNMYGAREVNTIAYECPQKRLHVVPQSVFLEVLDNSGNTVKTGETGNIVVTGLVNRVMPFIRYKLGDSGYLLSENCCDCGNQNPIIVLTSGRVTDIINLPKRQPISAVIFWYAIQHINFNYGNPIIQFQVRQKDIDVFVLLLVVENNENHDAIINYFYNFIADYDLVNSIKWTVEFVKYIYPNEKTGKLSYFINETKLPERAEHDA